MSHVLVCSTPAPGHVNPMLTIASSLAERGYDITFTTSDVFQAQVETAGLTFVPLRGKANFDYQALDQHFPERLQIPVGVPRLIHGFQHAFFDMIPDQHQTIQSVMDHSPVDLILTDTTFLGTFPLLLDPTRERPPVVSCGITVLFLTSHDRPPVGAPSRPGEEVRDYLREHYEFQAALRPADEYLDRVLTNLQVPPFLGFFLDALHALPDRYLQLTGDGFEFPCHDLPKKIRFVGPVTPSLSNGFEEPDWWSTLDSGKPVILVTQGTIANLDLSELLEPTLQALADEEVTVIASLGTAGPKPLSIPVPPNARVVPFVPFDRLMPKISLFITNGGYGSVNQALQNGVPLIVAGATEDKPFVAARVAWSGSGLDLETERPTADQIRYAVRTLLANDSFQMNAQKMAENFRQYRALDHIAAEVEWQIRRALEREVLYSVVAEG
ncbi:MAG: glycosyltransferase family 1 protein [Acidobacteriaceae bacterium]|nr:glycosyltransferase family 1 protein [Acidobacteriaceae bacterium]